MRDRPFIAAGEQPRPYSEIRAERVASDPLEHIRGRVLDRVAELEGEALEASDPNERKRLQCEAEELRCQLSDNAR